MIRTFSDFIDDISKRLPEKIAQWLETVNPDPRTWERVVLLFIHNINKRPLTTILKEVYSGILNGEINPPSDPKAFFQRADSATDANDNWREWLDWLANLIEQKHSKAAKKPFLKTIIKEQLKCLKVPPLLASQWPLPLASAILHSFDINSEVFDSHVETEQSEIKKVGRGRQKTVSAQQKTRLGINVNRLRIDCGWTYDDLALKANVDKKSILAHVNKGKKAYPRTLKKYADAFSKQLGRSISAAELLR